MSDTNILPDALKCFFEEIGVAMESGGKIWETECGNEVIAETLPKYCEHCQRTVEIAPDCRRCGSQEHTTGWHDADLEGKQGGMVQIQSLSGGDLLRVIIDNQREKE